MSEHKAISRTQTTDQDRSDTDEDKHQDRVLTSTLTGQDLSDAFCECVSDTSLSWEILRELAAHSEVSCDTVKVMDKLLLKRMSADKALYTYYEECKSVLKQLGY